MRDAKCRPDMNEVIDILDDLLLDVENAETYQSLIIKLGRHPQSPKGV
jgi:hypothetical protein